METKITQKNIDHPLDNVFDIVPNSTIVEYKEVVPAEVVVMPNYDEKDTEIEGMLQDVYDTAMSTTVDMNDAMERVEGKYKARIGEVSATMLSVALGAIREKSQLKMHKDKIQVATARAGTPHTINNNLVITDRNEILRMLQNKNKNDSSTS